MARKWRRKLLKSLKTDSEMAIRQFAVVRIDQTNAIYLPRALKLSVSRSATPDHDRARRSPGGDRRSQGHIPYCGRTVLGRRARIRASPRDRDAPHIGRGGGRRHKSL